MLDHRSSCWSTQVAAEQSLILFTGDDIICSLRGRFYCSLASLRLSEALSAWIRPSLPPLGSAGRSDPSRQNPQHPSSCPLPSSPSSFLGPKEFFSSLREGDLLCHRFLEAFFLSSKSLDFLKHF